MSIAGQSFSWFDFTVLLVIAIGIYRGRRRGMSEELLDVLKWLIIIVVGAIAYRPLGRMLSDFTHISPATAYVSVYLLVLITTRLFFGWIKRMVGEKLVGSDVFGGGEYYLGMVAGAVRFACYLLVGMAILNAVYISPEKLAAQARMQKENFGDISFPTLGSLQQNVFAGSVSGRTVKRFLGHELIVTTAADSANKPSDTLGRRSERAIDEVLGVKR